jgi:hypothetical protein
MLNWFNRGPKKSLKEKPKDEEVDLSKRGAILGAAAVVAATVIPSSAESQIKWGQSKTTLPQEDNGNGKKVDKEELEKDKKYEQAARLLKEEIYSDFGVDVSYAFDSRFYTANDGRDEITVEGLKGGFYRYEVLRHVRAYLYRYPPNKISEAVDEIVVGRNLNVKILKSGKVVKLSGHSDEEGKNSYDVAKFLTTKGGVLSVDPFDDLFNHEVGHNLFRQRKFRESDWAVAVMAAAEKIGDKVMGEKFKYLFRQDEDALSKLKGNEPRPQGFAKFYSTLSHLEDISTTMEHLMTPRRLQILLNSPTVDYEEGLPKDREFKFKLLVLMELLQVKLDLPQNYFLDAMDNDVPGKGAEILDLDETAKKWKEYWGKKVRLKRK